MGVGYEYIFLPDVNTYVFRIGKYVRASVFSTAVSAGESLCALADATYQSIVLRHPPRIELMIYYDIV